MIYNNTHVRRQDRLLEEPAALKLLQNAEYGILSMTCSNGQPYGIPINFVWDGKHSVYLHCAPEGRKLDCIRFNDGVSFCVVGKTNVLADKFSTEYESIIMECTAHIDLLPDERMNALLQIVEKYSPDYKETGKKYAEGSFERTQLIRLDINTWSGKCKKMINNG